MKHLKTMNEFVNEALSEEEKLEALQDLNADVAALLKKHAPILKKLDSKSAKAFDKLIKDFRYGIDDLSDY
jgi:hypothetical protein